MFGVKQSPDDTGKCFHPKVLHLCAPAIRRRRADVLRRLKLKQAASVLDHQLPDRNIVHRRSDFRIFVLRKEKTRLNLIWDEGVARIPRADTLYGCVVAIFG